MTLADKIEAGDIEEAMMYGFVEVTSQGYQLTKSGKTLLENPMRTWALQKTKHGLSVVTDLQKTSCKSVDKI